VSRDDESLLTVDLRDQEIIDKGRVKEAGREERRGVTGGAPRGACP